MAEKLKLVRRFEELRAGCIVVVKGCATCGASYSRGMIIGPRPRSISREPVFDTLPVCCIGHNGRPSVLSAESVAGGRVYLVDTGLEASGSTPQRTRKPKTVRA